MQVIWAEQGFTGDGWHDGLRVEIDNEGRIAGIKTAQPPDGYLCDIVLPGIGNLHSHTFQRAMAGLSEARGPSDSDSFWTWRKLMYRFLDALDPDDVEAIAGLAFIEMLEAGFTGVGEFHYLHHEPGGGHYGDIGELSACICAAASETSIGLTLLPVIYEVGGCDGRALAGGQLRFGNSVDAFSALHDSATKAVQAVGQDASIGVAPHSLRAVSTGTLKGLSERFPDCPIHIHIAEQTAEIDEVQSYLGDRPVRWLYNNLDVGPRWCLIHATHMEPDETRLVAQSGAVAGLCPITEASLGDGIFSGIEFVADDGAFGVGTDSNIQIDLAGELRSFEYSQRLKHRGRAMLADATRSTGRRLFEGSMAGGAQALQRGQGGIKTGAWADLVALDAAHPDLIGRSGDTVLDSFTFAGRGGMVRDVWSAGRHVVKDGQHVARAAIADRYGDTMRRLMAAL